MSSDPTILIVVSGYMVMMLGIGWLASRLARSPEQYFLAGRSLGAWVTAISSTASSESGWVVLGAVGMAYKDGVSALWFAPGCLLGYWVNLTWLAPRLREEAARYGSLTLPDILADRFGDRTHLVRLCAVVVIVLSLAGYLAAQLTATGKALQAILGIDYDLGLVVGGVIVIGYTLLGGFRAVSWTDFVQGLFMVGALVVMPLIVLSEIGGYGPMLSKLYAVDPALVSAFGGKSGAPLFGLIVGLLGIGLGYPGQPHVITRYMAASTDEKIRQARVIAMLWGVLVFYGAGILGLAGRVLEPSLMAPGGDPEQLFPILARTLLHPLVAGIMLAAILSAIMSTVSSQLMVVASSFSRDLCERVFRLTQSGRASVLAGRVAVLVVGVAAVLVALQDVRIVFWFVLFAWSGLGAAFGPVLLLGLGTDWLTRAGAIAGILSGFTITIAWKLSGLADAWIYELVPAFFGAGAMALLVSAIDRRMRVPSSG